MDDEIMMTKEQVAEMLGIKPRAVVRYVNLGKLTAISGLGKGYRFRRSSILEDIKRLESRVKDEYIEP